MKYIQRFGSLFGGDALCLKTFWFQYQLKKNDLKALFNITFYHKENASVISQTR